MSDDVHIRVGLVRCTCLFCNHVFFSERITAQYCTPSCKQKMYRWRILLRKREQAAIKLIAGIASYLVYDISTPRAIAALAEVSRAIRETLEKNNVKIV